MFIHNIIQPHVYMCITCTVHNTAMSLQWLGHDLVPQGGCLAVTPKTEKRQHQLSPAHTNHQWQQEALYKRINNWHKISAKFLMQNDIEQDIAQPQQELIYIYKHM